MATTYTELATNTPLWLYANNRDLVDEMPTIIAQAHEQLINVIDHDLFRTLITGKTVGTDGLIDLSAEDPRVLEVRGIRIKWQGEDSWTPIFRRDLETMTMLYARNRPRRPLYYSEYSGPLVLKVFPSPPEVLDIQVTANVEPAVLTVSNQTNVLSQQASRALEKATFRQAALFMKNWEDAQIYEKEMIGAVTEINAQIDRRRRDETGQRPVETANQLGQ